MHHKVQYSIEGQTSIKYYIIKTQFIYVMKGQAGIDLSDLTQAQRKMCVRLLAMNNVQFEQNQDNYIATLTVPSAQVNSYLNSHKPEVDKGVKKQTKKNGKINKQNDPKRKEKSSSKNANVSKTTNHAKKQTAIPKNNKKPLFKTVKLSTLKKLQILHPQVQIYIFPKRLPLPTLQEQLQLVYQSYWQTNKQESHSDFINTFYEIVCPSIGAANKPKNDQNLVNTLESINHFQHKQLGIKMFQMFLSEAYTKQQLKYFLVLRALVQELLAEKIINLKSKQKTLTQNLFTDINSNASSTNFSTKSKIKWYPHQRQISQNVCYNFLRVVVPNSQNVQQIFQKLTSCMYYCEVKKSNFIMYYDLMDFMIKLFNKECQQTSVSNLELSYSNNDSTLNDIMAESTKKSFDKPIQTKYQIQFTPECQLTSQEQQSQVFDNDQILMGTAIEKAIQMCKKVEIPVKFQKNIIEKVKACIQSILTMDKIKWVNAMQIEGTQNQLYFIEQIQMQYRNIHQQGLKLTMPNTLVKRIFSGPGFIQLFSSHITF